MVEAYSRECISAGWWPGTPGSLVSEPAFYAYAYPEPAGCRTASVAPAAAFYHEQMREWILPYEAVRQDGDSDARVLEFFESTYNVAATLARWDTTMLRSSEPTAHTAIHRA